MDKAIERIAAAGFQAMDFNFCDWVFPESPFAGDGWEHWIEEIARASETHGIHFTQAHGPIFFKWEKDERCQRMTELSHRSLRAAGRLGIPWVVFEPETDRGAWDSAHLEQLRRRNQEWFGPLLKTAEQTGTGLALENCTDLHARHRGISRWYGSVPAELIALVDGFEHPRVGICWDTGHAHIQGLVQGQALRALGPRLKALHIQDNNGNDDQHLAPHFGTVPWPEIMMALRNIGYVGDFTYEIHNFIRPLPDALRDEALRLTVAIGRDLLGASS